MNNNWKKKTAIGAITLALAIPTIASASTSPTDTEGANVDKVEEKKEQQYKLLEQFKNGDLTADDVLEQFRELRPHHPHKQPFFDLDDETKNQLTEIKEKVEAGELTEAEAKEQIEALGISPSPRMVALTDEQKQQLEEIHSKVETGTLTKEEAQEQLKELGIDHFKKRGKGHRIQENDTENEVESDL